MRYHSVDAGTAGYGIYFPDTFRLLKGSSKTLKILDRIIDEVTYEDLEKEGCSLSREDYSKYRKMLGEGISHELPPRDKKHLKE